MLGATYILFFRKTLVFSKDFFLGAVILAVIPFVSTWLTDKYSHKHPNRYYPYLLVSHLKFVIISFIQVWGIFWILKLNTEKAVWLSLSSFSLLDFLISCFKLKRTFEIDKKNIFKALNADESSTLLKNKVQAVDDNIQEGWTEKRNAILDDSFASFLEKQSYLKVNKIENVVVSNKLHMNVLKTYNQIDFLIIDEELNYLKNLRSTLSEYAKKTKLGGYLAVKYTPQENIYKIFSKKYKGFIFYLVHICYFVFKRVLPKINLIGSIYKSLFIYHSNISKAEMWGRLYFHGMEVLVESEGEGVKYVIARKTNNESKIRNPSYSPIIGLEKLGFSGEKIRIYKLRTMSPYSEFLQGRIYQDHGISSTGKFNKDYRVTQYGPFLRKYWIDELPQIYNWLRGDVKLVGLRAMSMQYLGLFSTDFQELYFIIKPGLIPPIYGKDNKGLADVERISMEYLRSYNYAPIITDIKYFYCTFKDIIFKGVRSQ